MLNVRLSALVRFLILPVFVLMLYAAPFGSGSVACKSSVTSDGKGFPANESRTVSVQSATAACTTSTQGTALRTVNTQRVSLAASGGRNSVSDGTPSNDAAESAPGLPEKLRDERVSKALGLILWLVVLAVLLAVVLILFFGRRGRDNRMPSGRVYARRREVRARPKRLLDEKYYQKPQNRKKF